MEKLELSHEIRLQMAATFPFKFKDSDGRKWVVESVDIIENMPRVDKDGVKKLHKVYEFEITDGVPYERGGTGLSLEDVGKKTFEDVLKKAIGIVAAQIFKKSRREKGVGLYCAPISGREEDRLMERIFKECERDLTWKYKDAGIYFARNINYGYYLLTPGRSIEGRQIRRIR